MESSERETGDKNCEMPKYCLNWLLQIAGNISCQNNVLYVVETNTV